MHRRVLVAERGGRGTGRSHKRWVVLEVGVQLEGNLLEAEPARCCRRASRGRAAVQGGGAREEAQKRHTRSALACGECEGECSAQHRVQVCCMCQQRWWSALAASSGKCHVQKRQQLTASSGAEEALHRPTHPSCDQRCSFRLRCGCPSPEMCSAATPCAPSDPSTPPCSSSHTSRTPRTAASLAASTSRQTLTLAGPRRRGHENGGTMSVRLSERAMSSPQSRLRSWLFHPLSDA
mmetsp:Transcript_42030/g.139691  ORF Transcript_42030/g.139691 Transcript_42030/m.139691 type:complete len:236 (-) Transcript_42030:280-987(-)